MPVCCSIAFLTKVYLHSDNRCRRHTKNSPAFHELLPVSVFLLPVSVPSLWRAPRVFPFPVCCPRLLPSGQAASGCPYRPAEAGRHRLLRRRPPHPSRGVSFFLIVNLRHVATICGNICLVIIIMKNAEIIAPIPLFFLLVVAFLHLTL